MPSVMYTLCFEKSVVHTQHYYRAWPDSIEHGDCRGYTGCAHRDVLTTDTGDAAAKFIRPLAVFMALSIATSGLLR